ncbi:MAG: hypothetical protein Q4E35_06700 [Eubacteriales bacterium]|nr:hypothetical protein [Eubacteriales bacterium]
MRGRRGNVGCAAMLAGLVIILALILPGQVWWFLLGAGLIFFGVWYITRCC